MATIFEFEDHRNNVRVVFLVFELCTQKLEIGGMCLPTRPKGNCLLAKCARRESARRKHVRAGICGQSALFLV
eukprot:411457-Rhodomonas_salina.1